MCIRDRPRRQQPLAHPFAYALVKLDGADTPFLHVVDAGSEAKMATGMRVNARWAQIAGYTLDESDFTQIGAWHALIHPDDRQRSRALVQQHFDGQLPGYECESRIRHKSGNWVWVLGRGKLLSRTDDGQPLWVAGIQLDITARKQAEDALRESERKLSTLMANLPGMAYRCLADDSWTMLFVSQGCTALTGYASEDLIGNRTISYDQIVHPDDRQGVHNQIHQALQAGAAFEIEYRIVTADGRDRWVWERGRQVDGASGNAGVLEGFILDVSERKEADEALRIVSREWQTTFDSVSDVMWLLDSQSRIQRCNRATTELFGPCLLYTSPSPRDS